MTGSPTPRQGETLALPERDYRYGVGPVVAVTTAVTALIEYDDEPWWQIDADVADGTPENHGGWISRTLYVRASSVDAARLNPPA